MQAAHINSENRREPKNALNPLHSFVLLSSSSSYRGTYLKDAPIPFILQRKDDDRMAAHRATRLDRFKWHGTVSCVPPPPHTIIMFDHLHVKSYSEESFYLVSALGLYLYTYEEI